MLPSGDSQLVQIIDAAFADAARRSGDWLVCRPGCTQCCHGVFEITLLDAERLQEGMRDLRDRDAERAARVLSRAEEAVARLSAEFPGDTKTGLLNGDDEAFERFADDEPCPALDPATGTCDVYASRPVTCRVFGPPVQQEGGLAVCELCYRGASDEEVSRCEMVPDPENLEPKLVCEAEDARGEEGYTIVAFALTKATR